MASERLETRDDGTTVLLRDSAKGAYVVAVYHDGCAYCDREKAAGTTFFPHHNASASCRSGRRNHCTCDTCF